MSSSTSPGRPSGAFRVSHVDVGLGIELAVTYNEAIDLDTAQTVLTNAYATAFAELTRRVEQ